ncbi:Mitochondrial carrier protein [Macleaya cordata]|uniref:Mitochondrial carrier protein n=1 Tax=Macleaya cordata TaxID=56857 RepID=A0A200Q7E2_MACCD|nr:Mitochondrial carrier protein [Macleaya cordata]
MFTSKKELDQQYHVDEENDEKCQSMEKKKTDPINEDVLRRLQRLEGGSSLDISSWYKSPAEKLPPQFKFPEITKYDGNGSPKAHIMSYMCAMKNLNLSDDLMAHFFSQSLIGYALEWIIELDQSRYPTWAMLAEAFIRHFVYGIEGTVTRRQLESMRQEDDESFTDFLARWRLKVREMINRPSEEEQLKILRNSVKPNIRLMLSIGGHDEMDRGFTAAAPFYRLEILRQVRSSSIINYMGTVQGLKYIWRTEGFRGLFKGNGTNCAHIVTYAAVKFVSYDQAARGILWLYRQQSGNEDANLTPLLRLGAVACAAIIATSATYPLDMVRGRLTVQTEKFPCQYRGMFHALSTVLWEEGPKVIFLAKEFEFTEDPKLKAKQIALLKEGKFSSKQIELMKDAKSRLDRRLAWWELFAAVIAHTVAYPFDIIHRRVQMVGWKNASLIVTGDGRSKATLEYTGMVDAFKKTVRNEGFGALYKGWVPNLVKVVPSGVVAVLTHKLLNDILGVKVNIKTYVIRVS